MSIQTAGSLGMREVNQSGEPETDDQAALRIGMELIDEMVRAGHLSTEDPRVRFMFFGDDLSADAALIAEMEFAEL